MLWAKATPCHVLLLVVVVTIGHGAIRSLAYCALLKAALEAHGKPPDDRRACLARDATARLARVRS